MKGIKTVFDSKKWVFCYIVLGIQTVLLCYGLIDGSQFMMGMLALIPVTVGASSFDKSVWRKGDPDGRETI